MKIQIKKIVGYVAGCSMAAGLSAHAGVVAHWQLNELGGTTANDGSGAPVYNGTYVNSPVRNGFTTFNGTDQYVNLPTGLIQNTYETARSFAAWVRFDGTVLDQPIIGVNDVLGGHGWGLNIINTGYLRFSRRGEANHDSSAVPSLAVGTWHHIGYSLASGGTLKFYVDGSQVGTDIAAGTSYANNSGDFYLGAGLDTAGNSDFLAGSMGDVRIYVDGFGGADADVANEAGGELSAADFAALYDLGQPEAVPEPGTATLILINAAAILGLKRRMARVGGASSLEQGI